MARQRIVYRFLDMQGVVDFALATLKERSPVGSSGDKHPGLYRDSHLVFLNGHVTKDVSGYKPGDTIDISSPVPYSRKIEAGRGKMTVPGHVYEDAVQVIRARFGNSVVVQFKFMPVRFGDASSFASFSKRVRGDRRRMSDKARQDWLVRQPALEIKAR